MLGDVANALVGFGVGVFAGLTSGYFFERRATRAAQHENVRLETELRALRESVYTVGGDDGKRSADPGGGNLMPELTAWLQARQDADGKVLMGRVTAEFVRRGFTHREVEQAIAELSGLGRIAVEGTWVRVR